jgi:dTDP-4-dehydrorhamnose 3,5-epimerase
MEDFPIVEDHKSGKFIDDRGSLLFYNSIDFNKIKRQYFIKNHNINFIRAWHGHKREFKFVTVVAGTAKICLVKIDDWVNPSKNLEIKNFILSSDKPSILYIPAGYANGFMNLTENTIFQFLSSSTTEESLEDDFRFRYDYWNPWENHFR